MRYFYFSFAVAIAGVLATYFFAGWRGAYICALLAVLEVALSFDNAVVNAKILAKIDQVWQRRFFVFGIPIAVFGMRFLFPIIVVSLALTLNPWQAFELAFSDPQSYHEGLSANKAEIYAFGGAFLLAVSLDFFLDKREIFWLKFIENNAFTRFFTDLAWGKMLILFLIGVFIFYLSKSFEICVSYFAAVALHTALNAFSSGFKTEQIKSGAMGFLYLEILDASFSFDGVIGAFAMSENIFIIMLGLGIGAMFVRSLTIFMVKTSSLGKFIFLEHGAHYAILALALIMIVEIFAHVSEIIAASTSFAFIAASFVCSLGARK